MNHNRAILAAKVLLTTHARTPIPDARPNPVAGRFA